MSFVHIRFLSDPFVGVPAADVEDVVVDVEVVVAAKVDKTEEFKVVARTEEVFGFGVKEGVVFVRADGVTSIPPLPNKSKFLDVKLDIFDIC